MTQPSSADVGKDHTLVTVADIEGTIAGELTDTNGAPYAAMLDAVNTANEQRMQSYTVLATDHGVQANVSGDQSANLQAAMDAAAASGADLILPLGVINLTQPVTWKCRFHSISGNQGTILNWSSAAFDGPAIILDGEYRPGTDGATPITIRDLVINGPTSPDTTVDCFQVAGYLNPVHNSIWATHFANINIHGFRDQEVIGTGSWCVWHQNVYYRKCVRYGVNFKAGIQTGEMMGWTDSNFDHVTIHATQAGALDVSLVNCSIDYSNLIADGGTFTLTGCHTERGWDTFPIYALSSKSSSHRAPNITFHGGVVVVTENPADAPETGANETVVVQTDTDGGPPCVVTYNGTQFISTSANGIMTAHKEVGSPDGWHSAQQPIVSIAGMSPEMRVNGSRSRLSARLNLLADGDFEASGAVPVPTGGEPRAGASGWYTTNSASAATFARDPNVSAFGGQSMKFTPGGEISALKQFFTCQPSAYYHISWWQSTDALTTVDDFSIEAHFWDIEKNLIDGVGRPVTGDTSRSGIEGTNAWHFVGGVIQAPPGAVYARLYFTLKAASGNFWLDDVQVVGLA